MSWYKPYKLQMFLLLGLTVQNMYTELRQGSKKAFMVVRNNTAYLQTLQKKTPVTRVVSASPVPKPLEEEQLLEGADESHDSHTSRLTVRQRHGKLFDELDLSGLDSWAPELVYMLLASSWPNTMMSSHWILQSWAVPIPQNIQ